MVTWSTPECVWLADYPSGLEPTFQARAGGNILAGSLTVSTAQAEASGVSLFDELLLRAAAGHYFVDVTAASQQVEHHHSCHHCLIATLSYGHPHAPRCH